LRGGKGDPPFPRQIRIGKYEEDTKCAWIKESRKNQISTNLTSNLLQFLLNFEIYQLKLNFSPMNVTQIADCTVYFASNAKIDMFSPRIKYRVGDFSLDWYPKSHTLLELWSHMTHVAAFLWNECALGELFFCDRDKY